MPKTVDISKRSILFISDLDIWSMGQEIGGPALSRTLVAYAQAGWEVVLISGSSRESKQGIQGVSVVRFDAPRLRRLFRIRRLGAIARAIWWMYFQFHAVRLGLKMNREYRFAAVYGYEITGMPAAKILSQFLNIPVIARYQGTSFGVGWPPGWQKYVRAWDLWVGLRTPSDLIIMTNDGTQGDRVLRELGADMSKLRFWMNGVDKDEFEFLMPKKKARDRLGFGQGKLILMSSRLVWWKRIDRALHAFPAVLNNCPDTVLVILGEGVERGPLEQLAANLGISDRVLFMGSVLRSDIPTYLAAADIFLSLYTWSNVGNPLLEAMLAGKCIVTLSNADTPKVVSDGHTGVLLSEEDLSPLPRTLISLLNDPERASLLGSNAREFALENFLTWEERLSMELEEVSDLVKQRSSERNPETSNE